MKTILRILTILLVASVVAGAFFLVVNNGTTTSSGEGGQPVAMAFTDGQNTPLMERPEGGEPNSRSVAGGISGVLGTFARLTTVALVVLSLEKGLKQWNRRKWNGAQG
jgi:hypothetical protein